MLFSVELLTSEAEAMREEKRRYLHCFRQRLRSRRGSSLHRALQLASVTGAGVGGAGVRGTGTGVGGTGVGGTGVGGMVADQSYPCMQSSDALLSCHGSSLQTKK